MYVHLHPTDCSLPGGDASRRATLSGSERSSSPGGRPTSPSSHPPQRIVSGSLRDRIAKFNNASAVPLVPTDPVYGSSNRSSYARGGMVGNRLPGLDPKTAGLVGKGTPPALRQVSSGSRGMIGNRIPSGERAGTAIIRPTDLTPSLTGRSVRSDSTVDSAADSTTGAAALVAESAADARQEPSPAASTETSAETIVEASAEGNADAKPDVSTEATTTETVPEPTAETSAETSTDTIVEANAETSTETNADATAETASVTASASAPSSTVGGSGSAVTSPKSSPATSPGAPSPPQLVVSSLPEDDRTGAMTPSSTRAEAGEDASERSMPSTPVATANTSLPPPAYDLVPGNLSLAATGVVAANGASAPISSSASISSSLVSQYDPVSTTEETTNLQDVSGVSTPTSTPRQARRMLDTDSVSGSSSRAESRDGDLGDRLAELSVDDRDDTMSQSGASDSKLGDREAGEPVSVTDVSMEEAKAEPETPTRAAPGLVSAPEESGADESANETETEPSPTEPTTAPTLAKPTSGHDSSSTETLTPAAVGVAAVASGGGAATVAALSDATVPKEDTAKESTQETEAKHAVEKAAIDASALEVDTRAPTGAAEETTPTEATASVTGTQDPTPEPTVPESPVTAKIIESVSETKSDDAAGHQPTATESVAPVVEVAAADAEATSAEKEVPDDRSERSEDSVELPSLSVPGSASKPSIDDDCRTPLAHATTLDADSSGRNRDVSPASLDRPAGDGEREATPQADPSHPSPALDDNSDIVSVTGGAASVRGDEDDEETGFKAAASKRASSTYDGVDEVLSNRSSIPPARASSELEFRFEDLQERFFRDENQEAASGASGVAAGGRDKGPRSIAGSSATITHGEGAGLGLAGGLAGGTAIGLGASGLAAASVATANFRTQSSTGVVTETVEMNGGAGVGANANADEARFPSVPTVSVDDDSESGRRGSGTRPKPIQVHVEPSPYGVIDNDHEPAKPESPSLFGSLAPTLNVESPSTATTQFTDPDPDGAADACAPDTPDAPTFPTAPKADLPPARTPDPYSRGVSPVPSVSAAVANSFPAVPDERHPYVEVHVSPRQDKSGSVSSPVASPSGSSVPVPFPRGPDSPSPRSSDQALPHSASAPGGTPPCESPNLSVDGHAYGGRSSGGLGTVSPHPRKRNSFTPRSPFLDDEDPGDFEPGEGWAVVQQWEAYSPPRTPSRQRTVSRASFASMR